MGRQGDEVPELIRCSAIQRRYGLSWYQVQQAVRAGALHPVELPGCKYPMYRRDEVIELTRPAPVAVAGGCGMRRIAI